MDFATPQFDWSLDPKSLRDAYKRLDFTSKFYKSINKDVIELLAPQKINDLHNLAYDEKLIHERLLAPLEKFICGKETLESVVALNQPSKLCRRILKTGDVTFACNDCGLDGTCVVCIDCFHKGAHKDHNYRMSNTDGGGCCDCGDPEAWKQNYACTDHMAPNQSNLSLADFEDIQKRTSVIETDQNRIQEILNRLSPDIASRYFMVCQASLHYARMLITWTDYNSLPKGLELDTTDPELQALTATADISTNYFTVLYNDEVHTYDFVINTLVKIIRCTRLTASYMASTVSREGRCLLINDYYEACKLVKDYITNIRDTGQNSEPLKVEVIHGSVLAHQAFALKLLEWIRIMATLSDSFRILTAYTLLGSHEPVEGLEGGNTHSDMTLIEKVMLSNTIYWKIARVEWNDLFVKSMLTDYSMKQQFARLLTRNYPKLMQYYMRDDHDASVSILSMTTQLYTVPSLTCMLIEEENALTVLYRTFSDACNNARRENLPVNFENRKTFDMSLLKRGFHSLMDVKYLLGLQPTKWTDKLRENVVEAVDIVVELLTSLQGMDSVRRQLGNHLEYEPDWESGMSIQSRLSSNISKLVQYCSYNERVLLDVLKKAQLRLLRSTGGYKMVTRELFGHQVNYIQYDVSTSPVSVHLPLSRFVVALTNELMQRRPCDRIPYDESLVILARDEDERDIGRNNVTLSMIDIMEPSLRTCVMVAQFRSGMWRRNGYSLINQINFYNSPPLRREMFDRDILALQECGAMCEANQFMIHLLNKFQLLTWISSETTREPLINRKSVSFQNDEEIIQHTMSLGEEFLQLLLTIVGERYRVGIGKIEPEDVIKNEMIQLLCIGPLTRSDLSLKLAIFNDNKLDYVKSVADFKRTSESQTGKYELKEEYYERFNPYFYHYVRRDQSNALSVQLERKTKLKISPVCCPPPKPVELTQQYRNLNQIIKCDILLITIQKVLTRAIGAPDSSLECPSKAPIRFTASDLQLDQCLHLIGLGLHEQERNPQEYNYLKAAHERAIFGTLKDVYEKAKRSKDLILWLLRKSSNIIKLLDSDEEYVVSVRDILDSVLSETDTSTQDVKKKSSELAKLRRERILARMKQDQEKFLSNSTTMQLMAETGRTSSPSAQNRPRPKAELVSASTSDDCETKMDQDPPEEDIEPVHMCIICRDEQKVQFDQPTMVLLTYIQRSAVLSKGRDSRRIPHYSLTPSNHQRFQIDQATAPKMYSFTSDNSWSFDATHMPSDLFFGPHISTCGHVMHYDCWKGLLSNISKQETSRPNRGTRPVSFDLRKHEILCPLCECISNATIPLLPKFIRSPAASVFGSTPEATEASTDSLASCLRALRSTVDTYKHVRHIKDSLTTDHDEKYMRLIQPNSINDALEALNEKDALGLRDFINTIRSNRISANMCNNSLLSSITSFSDRVHAVGLDLDLSGLSDVNHARKFMMTSWSIAYTIQAAERTARLKGSPLFEELQSPSSLCLSSLIKFACASTMTHQQDFIQSYLIEKLRYLLINDEHYKSSPCCLDVDAFEMLVSILVVLQKLYTHIEDSGINLTKPSNESGSNQAHSSRKDFSNYGWTTQAYDHEYFRNLVHLMLILNMLQVIISLQNEMTVTSTEQTSSSQESSLLFTFYKEIIITSGHPNGQLPIEDTTFEERIKTRLLPFLRSCALFFYHLTQVKPPEAVRTMSAFIQGKDIVGAGGESVAIEFDAICQYLDLPNKFNTLLRSQEVRQLARAWLRHPRVLLLINSCRDKEQLATGGLESDLMPVKFIAQPHLVNRLVDLPQDYSELVDRVSDFTCPSIKNEDSRTPTMCLVCGEMLCSQNYCCQRDLNDLASNYQQVLQHYPILQGQEPDRRPNTAANLFLSGSPGTPQEIHTLLLSNIPSASISSPISQQLVGSCTYHAHKCSGGVGIFLRIRNCQILLLSGKSKGCYIEAPYIDYHGEFDSGMLRGNPMVLNRPYYEKLQHMWLAHEIPRLISRKLEKSTYMSSINWHLH